MARGLLYGSAMNKLAAIALIALSSSVALAQEAPAPVAAGPAATAATTGAPQTESWDNVNHINGQVVPVGQENDYLKKYKRWNVSTNPLGWVLGSYGVSVSYGLNQNIAIRGDVNYFKPVGGENASGVELGVGVPIYFRRTYQGLFLEPGIISRRFEDTCAACSTSGGDTTITNTTFGPEVLVGWHWTWSSGLNFAIAGGVGRNWATEDTAYGSDEVFGNGYMRFGYAFN